MEKYYTPEQMQQFQELGERVGPDAIHDIEQRWTALMAEVRANNHLDPASPQAQELAQRWNALTEETIASYDDYPDLQQAIGENYEQNSFADLEGAPGAEDFAFIQKVNEARAS